MTNNEIKNITTESLRDWFKKEKWVRISSSGNIAGPCGTSKNKKNPDRCLPRAKAQSLTKAQRAATARKKKKAGSKGKTVVKNTKAATVKKESLWANINAKKKAGRKSSHKNSNAYKDAKKAGNAIKKETANPQDGKAAPYGSGYKPIKKMKEEKTISKKQITKLRDMIKSLKKSSKGHAGQADYLGKLVKEAMTKEKLLDLMKNQDDAIVRHHDGTEYVVYSPYSDNKDNADMWFDDSVIGLTRDGDEREFRYDDIDDVSVYRNETKEAPAGHYFTKSGNLVKGRMSADAKERGARKSDPKDKQRSKVPKATQYSEMTKEDITNLVVGTLAEMQNKKKKPATYAGKPVIVHMNGPETEWKVEILGNGKIVDYVDMMANLKFDDGTDYRDYLKEEPIQEDDRCTRLAKSKYDTWPSAYASGAVVRCRRGEIWKKK